MAISPACTHLPPAGPGSPHAGPCAQTHSRGWGPDCAPGPGRPGLRGTGGAELGGCAPPPDMLPAPERDAEGPTVRLAGGRAPAAAAQAPVVVAPGHAQQSPRPLPRGGSCVLPVPGVPSLVSEHPSWGDPMVTVGGRGLPATCIDGSQAVPSAPARGFYGRSRVNSHAGVLSPPCRGPRAGGGDVAAVTVPVHLRACPLPLGPVPAAPPGAGSWLRPPTCLGLPRRGLWAAAPPAWADHALQVWRAWGGLVSPTLGCGWATDMGPGRWATGGAGASAAASRRSHSAVYGRGRHLDSRRSPGSWGVGVGSLCCHEIPHAAHVHAHTHACTVHLRTLPSQPRPGEPRTLGAECCALR